MNFSTSTNLPLDNEVKSDSENLTIEKFIPRCVNNLKVKGEFREIISCFISFADSLDFEKSISKVMELTNQFGGYFNKIDFGDKGGVMLILFGAPSGKEKIYIRACDFSLAVKRISNFKMRIGLTFGSVFSGFVGSEKRNEYTALGMVVNLSARFMMRANWDEIFIDKYIYAQIKDTFIIDSLADSEFKGFSEKIPVFKLLGKESSFAKKYYANRLIGRDKELEKLKKMVKPIFRNMSGGIVYVDGIAGIGKTRFILEFENNINHYNDVNCFYMPCDEILKKSFNPIIYFLKKYFNQSERNTKKKNKQNYENKFAILISKSSGDKRESEIISEIKRTKSVIAGYLGIEWKNSLYSQLDSKGRYESFIYSFKNLIKAESLHKPVIIELDDGHWIDEDTKKMLKILMTNLENFPIMIISACRFNDDGSEFDFKFKEITTNRISLQYLSKDASKYLIFDILKTKNIPKETIDFFFRKSEGNPFFIEQILLYFQENQLFDNKFNIKDIKFEIPSNITEIIISRIDRLKIELKEVIKTASVIGKEFAIEILSKMLLDRSVDKYLSEGRKEVIWDILDELKYIFKHALIREAVYEMQLKKELRALHKLASEVIEEIYKNDIKKYYADLANHYEAAEILDKTIEYLKKAGDYAKENYQNSKAIDFYDRLLDSDLDISDNLRIDTLIKKGNIFKLIGKWNKAEESFKTALDLAEIIGDKSRISELIGSLGWQFYLKSNYIKAMEYFEKSLTIYKELKDKTGISRSIGYIGLIHWHQGNYPKAMEKYEIKIKICEELADKNGMALVLNQMGFVYVNQGNYPKAMKLIGKGLKIYKELKNRKEIAVTIGNIGVIYFHQGNFTKAMECYEQQLEICEELGMWRVISIALGNMGVIYTSQGNYEKSMEYFNKELRIKKELGDKNGISIVTENIGSNYFAQGKYAKAMECYSKAIMIGSEIGDKVRLSTRLLNKTNCLYKMQEYHKAKECNEKCFNVAKNADNKNSIFSTQILKEKINFKLLNSYQKKFQNLENLKLLLKDEKKEGNIAELNYEIAIMFNELKKESSEYKERAIFLFNKLYSKTPKIVYKNKIKELEEL